jgi:hypothetical protein
VNRIALVVLVASSAAALAGCGFDVQSPDVLLLTRTGQGRTVTVLVNDGGTIRCDGGKQKPISNRLLIRARDLGDGVANDAKAKLRLPSPPNSIYRYTISVPNGTLSFPDTAAARRPELASAEQFTLAALAGPCAGAG